ncbi:MAG: nucleoside deaminase [Sphaerochaetaceae bacterium]
MKQNATILGCRSDHPMIFLPRRKTMRTDEHETIMRLASEQARTTMEQGFGGPFGAAIVQDGKVIAVSSNSVLKDHDPTAHAEVNAIRQAGKVLGTHDLSGCALYATGYPCPMCMSAIIWANIKTVYFACTPQEAERIGFRDDFIYRYFESGRDKEPKLVRLAQTGHDVCIKLFEEYAKNHQQVY